MLTESPSHKRKCTIGILNLFNNIASKKQYRLPVTAGDGDCDKSGAVFALQRGEQRREEETRAREQMVTGESRCYQNCAKDPCW